MKETLASWIKIDLESQEPVCTSIQNFHTFIFTSSEKIFLNVILLRLSYPKWRDALQAARQRDLPPSDKAHLENLFALVEYFIPLVSYYHQIWFVRCLIVTICSKNFFALVKIKVQNFHQEILVFVGT